MGRKRLGDLERIHIGVRLPKWMLDQLFSFGGTKTEQVEKAIVYYLKFLEKQEK